MIHRTRVYFLKKSDFWAQFSKDPESYAAEIKL